MAYQTAGPQAWGGAGGAGAAPGMSDPYYAQYYAAYGYPSGYDYSAYYQQQGQAYPPGAAPPGAQPPPPGTTVAPPAPPSSPPPPGAEPDKAADADKPPPPPPGGPPPAPGATVAKPAPPAPPPGGPPPAPSSNPGTASTAAPSAAAASAAAANGGYDSAAYAQWYAQYGYYGYDPQYAQYWQQQQQQAPQAGYPGSYGAGQQPGYPQQHQQPKPGVPPPAPPKGDPPPGTGGKPGQAAAAAGSSKPYSGVIDSYNAQPPPANLYGQQNGHHNHNQQHNNRNQRTGLTGTNMTPLGPRPPPGDPPASAAGQQIQQQQLTPQQHAAAVAARFSRGPVVIRPQIPSARPAATPAYIAVGGASASAPATGKTGVAAAVAAAAANAAAAAAAAKSGSTAAGGTAAAGAGGGNTQWPPSFTAWVTRCFNAARLRGVPDSRLSEKLMAYLDQVKAEGRLWTTDWDTQPVMLPDGAAGSAGAASGADGGALSPSGPQGRKRNRWGAVPAGDSVGAGDYRSAAGGRGHERSQDVDSDEEDYGQYGQRHGAPSPHGGHQHLSNRKRKKLLALEARQQQQRGGGSHHHHHNSAYASAEEQKRRARAGRFGDGRAAGAGRYAGSESDDMSDDDYDDDDRRFGGGQIVVGTSNNLEKSYFRLTSQPDPATVRPEPVLTRALDRLVRLIAAREATYFYSLDQFKGMRQDCTVQHLRNALTVRVYEAHGRSSLEYGDVAEFNQCQARLGHLYAEGVPGCVAEFTGYRLLYETVHAATAGRRHAGSMTKALLHTMRNVPAELAAAPEIRHALKVREAVMNFNYSGFFRLYATAPHLGRAILDVVVEPLRWAGLNAFVKAADLPVPLSALALILGFQLQPPREAQSERKNQAADGGKQKQEAEAEAEAEAGKQGEAKEAVPLPGCRFAHLAGDAAPVADEEEAVQRCAQWLADHGAVVVEKGSELVLDTKASRGKLFVPEVTEKIETGDLSVTDFLSRARVAVE